MKPTFQIKANGKDVTANFLSRFVSLQVIEEKGERSDEFTITLADPLKELEVPAEGAELEVSLGYEAEGLREMGLFVVDDVEVATNPDSIRIHATGAPFTKSAQYRGLQSKKTRSFEGLTVGGLVRTIAGEHGLEAVVAPGIENQILPHLDQTDESNTNLLKRVAEDRGILYKLTFGKILYLVNGDARTVSGEELPVVTLRPEDVGVCKVTHKARARYASVVATWYDFEGAKTVEETAGEGEPVDRLQKTYPTQSAALAAARGKLLAHERKGSSFSITMKGNPDIVAETPILLQGFREKVDGNWLVKRAQHSFDKSGGFKTTLTGESRNASLFPGFGEDPENVDYDWSGELPPDAGGLPGENPDTGEVTYLHIAYADSPDGSTNFNQESGAYVGFLVDGNPQDSQTFSDYNWIAINGAVGPEGPQGDQGIPGEPGDDGKTTFFHVAFADSLDGLTNFNHEAGIYIGTYADFVEADSNDPSFYTWRLLRGPQGPQGEQGTPGPKGDDGQTSYFHTAYADSADGTQNFNQVGGKYIGTYSDFTQADSNDPQDYVWRQFVGSQGPQGDQGIPGTPGPSGQTPYLHLAYADSADGLTNFNQVSGSYRGEYVDFTLQDSNNPSDYNWSKIEGPQGSQGPQGPTGPQGPEGPTGPEGPQGPQGPTGGTGATGPRTASGIVYKSVPQASAPSKPSASSYNFANGAFSGLTSGWTTTPVPVEVTNTTLKYWACRWQVVESTFGGSQTITFSDAVGSINFGANIQSDNFVAHEEGVTQGTGWQIQRDTGDAEFNNVIVRGQMLGGSIDLGSGEDRMHIESTGLNFGTEFSLEHEQSGYTSVNMGYGSGATRKTAHMRANPNSPGFSTASQYELSNLFPGGLSVRDLEDLNGPSPKGNNIYGAQVFPTQIKLYESHETSPLWESSLTIERESFLFDWKGAKQVGFGPVWATGDGSYLEFDSGISVKGFLSVSSTENSQINNHEITDSSLELNRYGVGDRYSFVDFHSGSNGDYEARVIRDMGANGDFILSNRGTGNIDLIQNFGGGQTVFSFRADGIYINGVKKVST